MSLLGMALRWISEVRARRLTLDDLYRRMDTSGKKLGERLRPASATARNLEQARHVIGIERWGQARLRTLLGGPTLADEYDSYRPDALNTMSELADAFAATRADTLALIRELQQADAGTRTVPHNELGEIDARSWLVYLDDHATRELMIVR